MKINYFKLYLASVVAIFLILIIWAKWFQLGCFILLFPIIMLSIISYSFIELKMHERICFKNCYFKTNSFFAKMLMSRPFVIVFYLIVSIFMTFSALYGVIDYSQKLWLYLLVHIAFVIFLYKFIDNKFKNTIHAKYRAIFAREWTINISAILFIFVYIYFFIDGYEPTYLRASLEETYQIASNSISSKCSIVSDSLRLQREVDSISWWTIVNGTESISKQSINIGVWVLFIFVNSFTVLGINRFIVQIVYLLDKLFKMDKLFNRLNRSKQ